MTPQYKVEMSGWGEGLVSKLPIDEGSCLVDGPNGVTRRQITGLRGCTEAV
jgi:hypothetical protein